MDHYKCSWSKRLVAWSRFSHLVTAPQPLHNDSGQLEWDGLTDQNKISGWGISVMVFCRFIQENFGHRRRFWTHGVQTKRKQVDIKITDKMVSNYSTSLQARRWSLWSGWSRSIWSGGRWSNLTIPGGTVVDDQWSPQGGQLRDTISSWEDPSDPSCLIPMITNDQHYHS